MPDALMTSYSCECDDGFFGDGFTCSIYKSLQFTNEKDFESAKKKCADQSGLEFSYELFRPQGQAELDNVAGLGIHPSEGEINFSNYG